MIRLRVLLSLIVLSCLTTVFGKEPEYTVSPIGLIVTPQHPGIRVARLSRGHLDYDETFREPNYPEGGATVHCSTTRWIGVALLVQKPRGQPLEHREGRIRHVWTHQDLEIQHRNLDHGRTMEFLFRETATIEWEALKLIRKFKEDGLWTLRSYIGENLIAEQVFNLIDCEGEFQEMIRDVQRSPGN